MHAPKPQPIRSSKLNCPAVFAAAFTANYLETASLEKASAFAGELVANSIRATDPAHGYGVNFEYALKNAK